MSGKSPISISTPRLERVSSPFLSQRDIQLSVLRLDQIHPSITGNKWYKLRFNIDSIRDSGKNVVLSFGGAWSNHLMALASAGKVFGFDTIGVIRGELPEQSNPILDYLRQQGMQLHSVSRSEYRQKGEPQFLDSLRDLFGDFYHLPEGGSNKLAVSGCSEIAGYLQWQERESCHLLAAACGTGATLAGMILGLDSRQQWSTSVLGVSVLKAAGYMEQQVGQWLGQFDISGKIEWSISDAYHCGGYARSNSRLENFLACFEDSCAVPLEPVYTGKLALGLYGEIKRAAIKPGTEIIAIHSGGLQLTPN